MTEKRKYKVPATYLSWGVVEVEAENREELDRLMKDKNYVDTMPLPYEPEYIEDTYEIDFDSDIYGEEIVYLEI